MAKPDARERFLVGVANRRPMLGADNPSSRQDVKDKISLSNKGKKRTAEQRVNLIAALKDVDCSARAKAGWTDERKKAQSEKLTGRVFSEETRRKIGEKSRQKKMSLSARVRIGRSQYYMKSIKNPPMDFIDIWESQYQLQGAA